MREYPSHAGVVVEPMRSPTAGREAPRATTVDGSRVRSSAAMRGPAEAVGGSVDVAVHAEPVTGCAKSNSPPFPREQVVPPRTIASAPDEVLTAY